MAPPTVPPTGHGSSEVTPPPLFVEGDKQEGGVQTRPPEGRPQGFEKYNPKGFPYPRVFAGGPPEPPLPPGKSYGLKGEMSCLPGQPIDCFIFYDGKGSASGTWAQSEIVVKDSKAFQEAVIKLMTGQPGGGFSDLPGISGLKSSPAGPGKWKLSWTTTNLALTISINIVVTVKEGTNKAGVKFLLIKWEADPVGDSKPETAYFEPNFGLLVVEMPEGKPWKLVWKIETPKEAPKLNGQPQDAQKLQYEHIKDAKKKTAFESKLGNTAEIKKGIGDYVDALFIKIGGFAK